MLWLRVNIFFFLQCEHILICAPLGKKMLEVSCGMYEGFLVSHLELQGFCCCFVSNLCTGVYIIHVCRNVAQVQGDFVLT